MKNMLTILKITILYMLQALIVGVALALYRIAEHSTNDLNIALMVCLIIWFFLSLEWYCQCMEEWGKVAFGERMG